MGFYAAIISQVIGLGVKLATSAGGPDYPSTPKLAKIPIQKAKKFMEDYEQRRMDASKGAWMQRFPLLFAGGQYMYDDIHRNQQGMLSPTVKAAIESSGLESPREGDQYRMSRDLGLSPLTLSQRTSESVTRAMAQNPEWTNKISGGTLATMLANNAQNQNAFSQFLGANQTAQYVAGQQRNAGTTGALLAGIGGAAKIGMSPYAPWNTTPLSPTGQGAFSGAGQATGYGGGGGGPSQSTAPPYSYSGSYGNDMWNAPAPVSQMPDNPYGNSWDSGQIGSLFSPLPPNDFTFLGTGVY